MAHNKPSFIMYCEWQELFEKLDDAQAGKLIKHIFAYVNDENPNAADIITDIAFTQIKQQFKRDLKKYESIAERNALNGSKGGRPKTQKTQWVISETQTNPKNPLKDKGKRIKDDDKGKGVKEKKSVKDRMVDFQKKISPHIDFEFSRNDANDFWRYWTEMNPGGFKMRFEMQKTFDVGRRIITWKRNKKHTLGSKNSEKQTIEDWADNLLRPLDEVTTIEMNQQRIG